MKWMPTQGTWAADNGISSSIRDDECRVREWCSMLRYRAVSILGIDHEYGDTFLQDLATQVQCYTDSQPRGPQCKNNFQDATRDVTHVTWRVCREALDQKCQYEWRLERISSNVWAFLLRALKKHIDLATKGLQMEINIDVGSRL